MKVISLISFDNKYSAIRIPIGPPPKISVFFGEPTLKHLKALSTPLIADGSDFFEPLLYEGTAVARNITGLSFSPDLVFLKNRDRANYNWYWVDRIRGSGKNLFSNSGEGEQDAARLSSLNSDGFGLTDHGGPNYSGDDYVAYCFDGGSSETDVSIGGANAAANG